MIKFAQEYGFAGGDRKSVKNAELAYKHVLGKDTDILKNLVEVRSGFNEQLNEIVKDRRKGKIESFDFDKYDDKIKKPKSTIKNSVTTKAFNELRGNERSASGGPVSVA